MADPTGPLSGLRIADFSRVLAGPYATMLLADMGADVVKVERPGVGDDTRGWGPPFAPDGMATYFAGVNRNKRSIVLDLSDPKDADAALEIAARSDVLIENFSPGVMERMGLGYDAVSARNPGIVYCSITGFGSGQGAGLPGYDLVAQAVGGLMSITGPDPEHPTKVGVALVDVITGLHAVAGILAAIHHRAATGAGQRLQVSLLGSLLSALVNQAAGFAGAGVVPRAMGNDHPSIAPYGVYRASDRPLVVAVGNDAQFRRLADALGEPGLADDPRFATNTSRVAGRSALDEVLQRVLVTRAADDWQDVLTASGVPCGPVNDIAQAFGLAQRLGLDPIVDGHQVRHPIDFSATPVDYRLPPPRLGEQSTQVRRWLGTPEGAPDGAPDGASG